jgi:hypothetical protein
MWKSAVLAFFDNNQSAVARALRITRASVNAWPDLIPEASAYRLERITNGGLTVDPSLYDEAKGRTDASTDRASV